MEYILPVNSISGLELRSRPDMECTGTIYSMSGQVLTVKLIIYPTLDMSYCKQQAMYHFLQTRIEYRPPRFEPANSGFQALRNTCTTTAQPLQLPKAS